MELVQVISVWLFLLRAIVKGSDLPKLPNNELLTGDARFLPNAVVIECGSTDVVRGIVGKKSQAPSKVVTSANFETYAFTAGPIGSPFSPKVRGNQAKFTYVDVTGKKTMQALQVDPSGEDAYWLPQGGVIDIPKVPSTNQPKYVFTADFSGCSWTVTPMDSSLRLRHVEGGYEDRQFNNLNVTEKGGETSYAMQFMDYGYIVETARLVQSIRSFAYMHFDGTQWTLNLQRQTCAATPGGYVFNERKLLSMMTMLETSQRKYQPVTGTKVYTIPST